jgi:hypothetical protein
LKKRSPGGVININRPVVYAFGNVSYRRAGSVRRTFYQNAKYSLIVLILALQVSSVSGEKEAIDVIVLRTIPHSESGLGIDKAGRRRRA